MKHIVANRFLFSAAIFLMYISIQKYELLGSEQRTELGVRTGGDGQNLIARCSFCGKEEKFGVY